MTITINNIMPVWKYFTNKAVIKISENVIIPEPENCIRNVYKVSQRGVPETKEMDKVAHSLNTLNKVNVYEF